MGYSSQSGQMLLRTQDSAGVFPVDFGTTAIGLIRKSGTLAPSRDLMVLDAEIGGNRDRKDAYMGPVSYAGDLEYYCRMETQATLCKACLGTSGSVTTAGVTTHTITPTESSQLPFLAIEEEVSNGLETWQYVDGIVNTLHFEVEPGGYLQGTAGLIARRQTAGATPTSSPVWEVGPPIVGTNVSLTYNGITVGAKSFSLDINNNLEDDDWRLGSFYLGDLTAKQREVSGSFTVRPQDSSLWRQAVYGTSGATTPGGVTTKSPIVVTATAYENIGATATPSQITFTLPKCVLEPYSLDQSGDDVIENDVTFQALRPLNGTPLITIVIKNGRATIA